MAALKTVGYAVFGFGMVAGMTLTVGLAVAGVAYALGLTAVFGDCPRC